MRHVRGLLFLDYVRMLRAQKSPRVAELLTTDDHAFLAMKIDPDGWYPMATFERLGNAILALVANNEMFPVQLWGRYSASLLHKANPMLLEPNAPAETLHRFRVFRQTFFDFDALEVPLLHDGEAHIVVRYHMGLPAEEAATYQTMGFFEGLLELSGAKDVRSKLETRSWAGDPRTMIVTRWTQPH